MDQSMLISPKYCVRDWENLNLTTEDDWQKAVDMFEDRICGRFLSIIAGMQKKKFAGFAVLALDCLLIETLQQFREGKRETPQRKAERYFVNFLTGPSFGKWFDQDMAKKFYDQVRCGILHQAETKGTTRVVRASSAPLAEKTQDGEGLNINRKVFHAELIRVFSEYGKELRDGTNAALRANFRKKMNYICRVGPID